MSFISFTSVESGPVLIEATPGIVVSISTVLPDDDGVGGGTLIRTTDGRELIVTETVDGVVKALAAAHKAEHGARLSALLGGGGD